ncbi:MAG TPA: hypothetical protein DSN98_09385 [Thermoplasmata archaeon]|jgi:apoptosis-inducing factor 2|nr:MAG TPA: hypothetical protein DSN98_09385 [Thermoplasmata archaeon]
MRIIILGGGFCGTIIAKKLEKQKTLDIVIIDKKEYFEYSPSLWKLLLKPLQYEKYIVPFAQFLNHSRIITDPVLQVTPKFVETEKEKLTFDYLVISTGIEYPIFLDNTQNVFTIKSGFEVLQNSKKIVNAKSILIIGGGLIGTEIAGELATKSPEKQIIMVHPHDRLLERKTKSASRYAKKYLDKRGVQIIFGEKVVDYQNGIFITNLKRTIKADVGIWCAGIKSDPWFMKEFPPSIFTELNTLKVNQSLQLENHPNIFVGGDITNVLEEKTAANAKRHGSFIVMNILRSMKQKQLIVYKPRKGLMIISLGRWDGILMFGKFLFPGFIPAMIKLIIEKVGIKRL